MKYIAIFLLALLFVSSYAKEGEVFKIPIPRELKNDNGYKEAAQIVGGIIFGALKSYNNIDGCFNDATGIFQDFTNAYISLKAENARGVEDGLIHIGRALLKIPNAVSSCKDIAGVITTLRNAAVKFSNPTLLVVTVGKNIIWHSVSIFKQVRGAVEYYRQQNWFQFGVNIGAIIDMVFLKNENYKEGLGSSGSEFLNGFAHGVSPDAYADVSKCIKDVSPITWNRIEKDIKDISWHHVERSVKDIEDIGKIFVSMLKDCKSGSVKVKNLITKLSEAFSAGGFIRAALAILKNPLDFVKRANAIVNDFKGHKYFAAGDETGSFVGKVLNLRAISVVELLKE